MHLLLWESLPEWVQTSTRGLWWFLFSFTFVFFDSLILDNLMRGNGFLLLFGCASSDYSWGRGAVTYLTETMLCPLHSSFSRHRGRLHLTASIAVRLYSHEWVLANWMWVAVWLLLTCIIFWGSLKLVILTLPFSLSSLHNQEGYVWGQWKSILILDLRNVLLADITIIATQRLRDLIK